MLLNHTTEATELSICSAVPWSGPAKFPVMPVSLHMGWRHLLFANWPVSPEVLEPHIPSRLGLDLYDGRAWLSVTPFTNVDVRPAVFPTGVGLRLPELNLRTYVTYDDEPGVYFLSLDVDSVLAVLGARLFHRLPYFHARVTLEVDASEVRFSSIRRHPGARPVDVRASYRPVGAGARAEPGSFREFIAERYRYYTEGTSGGLRYARVEHDPWRLHDVEAEIRAASVVAASGLAMPADSPRCFYSRGVDTIVSPNRPVG